MVCRSGFPLRQTGKVHALKTEKGARWRFYAHRALGKKSCRYWCRRCGGPGIARADTWRDVIDVVYARFELCTACRAKHQAVLIKRLGLREGVRISRIVDPETLAKIRAAF